MNREFSECYDLTSNPHPSITIHLLNAQLQDGMLIDHYCLTLSLSPAGLQNLIPVIGYVCVRRTTHK